MVYVYIHTYMYIPYIQYGISPYMHIVHPKQQTCTNVRLSHTKLTYSTVQLDITNLITMKGTKVQTLGAGYAIEYL